MKASELRVKLRSEIEDLGIPLDKLSENRKEFGPLTVVLYLSTQFTITIWAHERNTGIILKQFKSSYFENINPLEVKKIGCDHFLM